MASAAIRREQGVRRAFLAGSWPQISAYLSGEALHTAGRAVGLGFARPFAGGHFFQTSLTSDKEPKGQKGSNRSRDITKSMPSGDAAGTIVQGGSRGGDRLTEAEGRSISPSTSPSTSSASTSSLSPSPGAPATSWGKSLYRTHIEPYMLLSRVDKPIGTWLLLWPSWWSICLANPAGLPDLTTMGMFGAGAVLLRGAGCTVNDMWDRDFDRAVKRTKTRPLASGALTQGQALGWLAIQLSTGLGILLQLPPTSQMIGAASLPFVVAYPLMKRWWGWPQAFLGITINWGTMMGWAAIHDGMYWSVVGPLYASGFFWTLVYDTIYAHQDKKDDLKVGVKSTALTFGDRTKSYLAGFGGANIACLATAGAMAGCHTPFYLGAAAAGAHMAWQVGTVDLDDADDCMAKFKSNFWYGALVCAGIVTDRVLW